MCAASFYRQLNLWGFERVGKTRQQGSMWRHPNFIRDAPERLSYIHRCAVKDAPVVDSIHRRRKRPPNGCAKPESIAVGAKKKSPSAIAVQKMNAKLLSKPALKAPVGGASPWAGARNQTSAAAAAVATSLPSRPTKMPVPHGAVIGQSFNTSHAQPTVRYNMDGTIKPPIDTMPCRPHAVSTSLEEGSKPSVPNTMPSYRYTKNGMIIPNVAPTSLEKDSKQSVPNIMPPHRCTQNGMTVPHVISTSLEEDSKPSHVDTRPSHRYTKNGMIIPHVMSTSLEADSKSSHLGHETISSRETIERKVTYESNYGDTINANCKDGFSDEDPFIAASVLLGMRGIVKR